MTKCIMGGQTQQDGKLTKLWTSARSRYYKKSPSLLTRHEPVLSYPPLCSTGSW